MRAPRACLTACCVRAPRDSFAAIPDGGKPAAGRLSGAAAVAAPAPTGVSSCRTRSTLTISQAKRHAVARPASTHPIAIARCFHQARRRAFTPVSKTSMRLCSPDDAVQRKPTTPSGASDALLPAMRSSSFCSMPSADSGASSSSGASSASTPRERAICARRNPSRTSSGMKLRKNQNAIAAAASNAWRASSPRTKRADARSARSIVGGFVKRPGFSHTCTPVVAQPLLFTVAFRRKMAELTQRERQDWLAALAARSRCDPSGELAQQVREVARGCRLPLADSIQKQLGPFDARHLRALLEVPRERFVHPDDLERSADDTPLPLDERGLSTISAPHAYCLSFRLVELEPGDALVELGTGSGTAPRSLPSSSARPAAS